MDELTFVYLVPVASTNFRVPNLPSPEQIVSVAAGDHDRAPPENWHWWLQ